MLERPERHFSIHDVVPATLGRVLDIVSALDEAGAPKPSLLVVPGCEWSDVQVDTLRALAGRGHQLAGHGWKHRITGYGGLYHRLHALLISRDVAEHLSLGPDAIVSLMQRCRAWFKDHDLPLPETYVPPAWAMGRVSRADLAVSGFSRFETMAGIYDASAGRFEPVPLIGFEADTRLRALTLTLSNAANLALGRLTGKLRIAIHPFDFELRLCSSLERVL